ncbi:hypothetical protein OROGR_003033 [Orobanche gracilis]
MRRGSKKRKAAKKKKENQSENQFNHSSASAHSNDEENVMHQDEKDSDVGDVSTPGSQDHHNPLNLLTDGEEEEIEEVNSVPDIPFVDGLRTNGSVVQVEIEINNEYKSYGENGSVEYDEVDDPFPGRSAECIRTVPIGAPEKICIEKYEENLNCDEKDAFVQSVEETDIDRTGPFGGSEKVRIEKYEENLDCVEKEAVVQSVEETDIDIISDQEVFSTQASRPIGRFDVPRDDADDRAQQEKEYAANEVPCWFLLHVQREKHHGEVAVDCLKFFRGLEDNSEKHTSI